MRNIWEHQRRYFARTRRQKKYPDALFQFEWADDDNKFLDKSDIDAIISQPFVPDWFVNAKSHLHSAEVNRKDDSWTLS